MYVRAGLVVFVAGVAWLCAQPGGAQRITLITALAGPNFCNSGYQYRIPAFCTAPDELPLGSFRLPAVGGSYVDPNFGAKVRVLTDSTLDSVHGYSTPSAFSANAKYALAGTLDGHVRIIEIATAKVVTNLSTDFDLSSARWSATDDDVLYSIGSSSALAQITKYQVSTRNRTTLVDYARDSHRFSRIETGGTGDVSSDNWVAFWAAKEHQVCAFDLIRSRTYCIDYTASQPDNRVGWDSIDYAVITKGKDVGTNRRYVLLMASPAMGAFSVNEDNGTLDFEYRGPEIPAGMMGGDSGAGNKDSICDPGESCVSTPHADVFQDRGKQYLLLTMGFDLPACEADLVSLEISKGSKMLAPVEQGGGRKNIMKQYGCGLTWSSSHIGCARASAYCVISMDTPEPGLPSVIRDGTEPYHSEVMVMRGNGAEVRRLAMHRSVQWQYWDQPRACISSDGSLVLWDSNFGVRDNHRIVVAETGFTAPGTSVF
jgi:hypothetical protein